MSKYTDTTDTYYNSDCEVNDASYYFYHIQLEEKHLKYDCYMPEDDIIAHLDGDLEFQDDEPDYEEQQRQNKELVKKLLGGLTEKQRKIVDLYYFKDMTIRQVAKELNLSLSTVQKTLKGTMNYELNRKHGGILKRLKNIAEKGCDVIGCSKAVYDNGLCADHSKVEVKGVCVADGCNNKVHSKRMCRNHYHQQARRLKREKTIKQK